MILRIFFVWIALSGAAMGQSILGGISPPNNITEPYFNATTSTGYQIGGLNALSVTSGTAYQQGVFVGPRAGLNAPASINFGVVGIGAGALQQLTAAGSEAACGGTYACQILTTAYANTGWGEHVIGWDNSNYLTAIGNDAMRDTVGNTGSTAGGATSQWDGVGSSNTTWGALALQGNAGSILIGGTVGVGDKICLPFTTTNANVNGLPASACYTTVGGDTLSTLATALASAVHNLNVYYTMPDGGSSITEMGLRLDAFTESPAYEVILALHFPGGQTQGWAITLGAPTCTLGTCAETFTQGAPFSGTDDIAIGVYALLAANLTTGSQLMAIGDDALAGMGGTSTNIIAIGYYAAPVALTGTSAVVIGNNAAQVASVLTSDIIIGQSAGNTVTTGTELTIISQPTSGTLPTTGSNITMVGYGCRLPSTATTSHQGCLANVMYWTGNNIGPGGSAYGQVGFGGDVSAGATVGILGPDTTGTTIAFRVRNSTPSGLLAVYDGGDVVTGSGLNLSALTVTAGFFHFPFTNATSGSGGIPTGTPANVYGNACVWNDVTYVLNCYSASAAAWKHVAFSANAG